MAPFGAAGKTALSEHVLYLQSERANNIPF